MFEPHGMCACTWSSASLRYGPARGLWTRACFLSALGSLGEVRHVLNLVCRKLGCWFGRPSLHENNLLQARSSSDFNKVLAEYEDGDGRNSFSRCTWKGHFASHVVILCIQTATCGRQQRAHRFCRVTSKPRHARHG